MKDEYVPGEAADDLQYFLALWHTAKLTHKLLEVLRKYFSSWQQLFSTPKWELTKLGLPEWLITAIDDPSWHDVEKDLLWLNENPLHKIIRWESKEYPQLLREIQNPPLVLFINGNIEILHTPQISMVGSRNPSRTGIETARDFSMELAITGLTITSGLAIGIDTACHRGALDAGGKTIAVMGTGIEIVYPHSNVHLAKEIISSGGALVTEFPLGKQPYPQNFPQRNRIISGLSLGTLVLEATQHSGSLITARLAAEQCREVFAIPGSIHNPLARGCHVILRQGAKLVETANDILEELGPLTAALKSENAHQFNIDAINEAQKDKDLKYEKIADKKNSLDPDCMKLLECIGDEVTAIDVVIARSRLSAQEVSAKLIYLELNGLIQSVSGGYIKTCALTFLKS